MLRSASWAPGAAGLREARPKRCTITAARAQHSAADRKAEEGRATCSRWLAAAAASLICLQELPVEALPRYEDLERAVGVSHATTPRAAASDSHLPDKGEAQALLQLNQGLFTDDAWQGMLRVQEYAAYIEGQADREAAPGCEMCGGNRRMLERTWQVVANEFYDPHGGFTQSQWAERLLTTLQDAGGVIRTKPEVYHAVESMVASLGDKYSEFLRPSAFRHALRRPTRGERVYAQAQAIGVGVHLSAAAPSPAGWVIDTPMACSPAEEAGLQGGDAITEADGVDATGLSAAQMASVLRGAAGTMLPLRVVPREGGPPRLMALERRALPQPALRAASLPAGPGKRVTYARMLYFSSDATRALAEVLERGQRDDATQGFILDLRSDPGGVFEEAIAMASQLLPREAVVADTVRNESEGRNVVDHRWQVSHLSEVVFPGVGARGQITDKALVVLVNHATASASEVLAGALMDNGRATVIGDQTFGKGVVQYYFPMGDGSGLKLTIAKYLSPAQYDITQRGGIVPQLQCSDFPHGVLSSGAVDDCVLMGLDRLRQATE